MQASSPRFKSLAVTAGLSFWFFMIISSIGIFTFELLIIFVASLLATTQIFALKISKALDIIAIINTSMNVMGEPIVNTPQEAYQMILKTDMDFIVLGNNLVKK